MIGDKPITSVNTARLQSLLAYLVLHRTAQLSRRHLAFTFWPDKTESQAQNNLRQLLYQLRQALPDSNNYFFANASTLGWQQNSSYHLDVLDFEDALNAALVAEQAGDLPALKFHLEQCLSLYRDELLPSCYDDWIIPEREKLHQKYIEALNKIIHILENQHSYVSAISYARQLLHTDYLDENNYQILMRLYALNGERANALHIYHQCSDTFQRELREEPGAATQELYRRLLRHQELSSPPLPMLEMVALPPLIGREAEWQQMIEAWQSATTNGMRFVLLEGEAGIGKSRLAEELLSWVAHQGFNTGKTRSYAAEGRLAYGPIAEWLRCEAVRHILKNLAKVWKSEIARLLPELLIETPDLPHPEPLKENWQRQSFYQALTKAFLSVPQPLLLLIDDLQWCDPETLEWLHFLLRMEPTARLLIVGTVRLEELMVNQALQDLLFALRNAGQISEIELGPLDSAETARLAAHIAGYQLEIPIASHLFKLSEGNPLFVLETIRSGTLQKTYETSLSVDPGLEITQALAIAPNLPPKVNAVLLSRLAALSPPARQLASLAATVGRAFSYEVLAQASDSGEEDLLHWLDELWQRRIVRVLDEHTYDFSHDKLREVAISQVSLPHRRALHRRVAQALEIVYATNLDAISGQLAAHFEQAGKSKPAIHYYYRAALVAQRINANREAISLLERALRLLITLPEDHGRDAMELDLQTALGVSTIDTLGHGAVEVIQIYDRALALCQRLGQPPTPPILRAQAVDHIARAEFKQALGYSEQLTHLAEHQEDRLLMVEANYTMGVTMFWLGAFQASKDYLEKAVTLYVPQDSHLHISLYSQNPKVICESRLAFTLWCLGYSNQAVEANQLALDHAAEIVHPWSLAYASFWHVFLLIHNREFNLASQRLAALIKHCHDYQIRHFLLECTILQGWLQAEQGEIEAGIAKIQDGMERFRVGGAEFKRPLFLSLLAELLGRQGDIEQGLALLVEAGELIEKSEERWCEAEILRRQGELLWRKSDTPSAEEAFKQALQVARSQAARMLELRAALALGRMWLRQGKASQAEELIAPLYRWFHEGLDTPDLQDACLLLAEAKANSEN
jgi:DNA-binding SARP family transcriptional activator/predicted ATPase